MNVASYIFNRYAEEYGNIIDEMKLHKLMYFSQRESFIQNYQPLFNETFSGWKFGPVLKTIRGAYKNKSFEEKVPEDVIRRILPVMNKVFDEYAGRNSWSLSRLTHGELSWKNSRLGVKDWENSDRPMRTEDIALDAERIRNRRNAIAYMKMMCNYENN